MIWQIWCKWQERSRYSATNFFDVSSKELGNGTLSASRADFARSCSNGFHWHGNTKVGTGKNESSSSRANNMRLLKKIYKIKKVGWVIRGWGGVCHKLPLCWCQKPSNWLNPMFTLKRPFSIWTPTYDTVTFHQSVFSTNTNKNLASLRHSSSFHWEDSFTIIS